MLNTKASQLAARVMRSNRIWPHLGLEVTPCLYSASPSTRVGTANLCSWINGTSLHPPQMCVPAQPFQHHHMMSTNAVGSRNLMDFPHVLFPSFIKMAKNVFLTWFVIRPYLDPNFSFKTFIEGAKQGLLVVSDRISRGDFAGLSGLVTPEALAEIKRNYSTMSVKERCDLKLHEDHFGPVFPYEIGMIIEEEEDVQKRWVEITVCAHVHRNFAHRTQPTEEGFVPPYQMPDFTVCNYRFIRNYTKGVHDTWTVNVVNHFRPNSDRDE